jgi:hypothetical protein
MYGEDDYPDEDRVVISTPFGAVVQPVSLRRMSAEARDTYLLLQRVGHQIAHLEQHAATDLVPAARDAGLSWSVIGAALGITGEGARKRYERRSDS